MALLKTDYKDDVLDTSVNTSRRYRMVTNSDGTISLEDVTVYLEEGDIFGAVDINKTNEAVNKISPNASGVKYNNATSGSATNNVQDALDDVYYKVKRLEEEYVRPTKTNALSMSVFYGNGSSGKRSSTGMWEDIALEENSIVGTGIVFENGGFYCTIPNAEISLSASLAFYHSAGNGSSSSIALRLVQGSDIMITSDTKSSSTQNATIGTNITGTFISNGNLCKLQMMQSGSQGYWTSASATASTVE